MKRILLLILILLQVKSFSQSSNCLSLTFSNNGQFNKVLEFYQPFNLNQIYFYTGFGNTYDNPQAVKLNLHYERGNDSTFYWSIKASAFLWKEDYESPYRNEYYKTSRTQNIYSFSVGWMKSIHLKNFIISGGL